MRDDDQTGSLTIKYKLDESYFDDLAYVSIYNNETRQFTEAISLENLRFGSHSIELYAIDDDEKVSNHQYLNFKYVDRNLALDRMSRHVSVQVIVLFEKLLGLF